jgi:hypothetical protein
VNVRMHIVLVPDDWPGGHSATPAAATNIEPLHGRCGNAAPHIYSDEIPDCLRNGDVQDGANVGAPCAACVFRAAAMSAVFFTAESLRRLRELSGVTNFDGPNSRRRFAEGETAASGIADRRYGLLPTCQGTKLTSADGDPVGVYVDGVLQNPAGDSYYHV